MWSEEPGRRTAKPFDPGTQAAVDMNTEAVQPPRKVGFASGRTPILGQAERLGVARQLHRIGIELGDLIRSHAGAHQPTRHMDTTKPVYIGQQPRNPGAGRWARDLERVADQNHPGR